MLERFHLTIEKRPRYGIRVAGDEMNRRICLASIAVDTRLADDELSGAISPDMLDTVGACVSDALEAEQYKINHRRILVRDRRHHAPHPRARRQRGGERLPHGEFLRQLLPRPPSTEAGRVEPAPSRVGLPTARQSPIPPD